jgi:hypothetical protein
MNKAQPEYRLPAQHLLSAALSTALASCTAQSARKAVAPVRSSEDASADKAQPNSARSAPEDLIISPL